MGQIQRAIDQTDMAVGLGKIAEHVPARRIELFREQPHVVAATEQPFE
jgi:hypothetical protein